MTEHTPKTDSLARQVAAEILAQVLSEYTPLDVCINRSDAYHTMPPADKAFCLRLMQTYLRRKGQVDAEIKSLMQRPLPDAYLLVQIVIGLAMVQVADMDIPSYAAVHSAVELVKLVSTHHVALANAVLNSWVKQGGEFTADVTKNIPEWLRHKWQNIYGDENILRMAEIMVQEPALDMSFKHASDMAEVQATYPDQACPIWGNTLRISRPGQVSDMPGYAEGHWWVQDVAASLPVQLFGELKGKRVLDMCAAPGGKTMQLASLGAHVTAVDSSKKRLHIVAENLARTGLAAELVEKDVLKYHPEGLFDAILLDAPCSATGTYRRNPDVLWTRTRKNLLEITEKQYKMLDKAVSMIPTGGIIIYAVCSMEPEEGEEQIKELLKRVPHMRVDLDGIRLPITLSSSEFGLRALPGANFEHGGMDGFFMTRLRKV